MFYFQNNPFRYHASATESVNSRPCISHSDLSIWCRECINRTSYSSVYMSGPARVSVTCSVLLAAKDRCISATVWKHPASLRVPKKCTEEPESKQQTSHKKRHSSTSPFTLSGRTSPPPYWSRQNRFFQSIIPRSKRYVNVYVFNSKKPSCNSQRFRMFVACNAKVEIPMCSLVC